MITGHHYLLAFSLAVSLNNTFKSLKVWFLDLLDCLNLDFVHVRLVKILAFNNYCKQCLLLGYQELAIRMLMDKLAEICIFVQIYVLVIFSHLIEALVY